MKDRDELIEKKLQLLMQQSREEAPEGFAGRLMQALPQQQPLPQRIFKPLLSIKVLAIVISILAGLGWLGSYFLQPSSEQKTVAWLSYYLPEFSLPLTIDGTLLTIVLTAIVFLAALDSYLKRSLGPR